MATVGDALLHGRKVLVEFGGEGRFDALRLLEEMLERNAAWIFAHGDERLGDAEAARYAEALESDDCKYSFR